MSGEVLSSVLKVISNRIRRDTIQLLNDKMRTYLELLVSCGLDVVEPPLGGPRGGKNKE